MAQEPVMYDELSWQQRRQIRESYVRDQGGNCYYCAEPLTGAPAQHVLDKTINHKLFPPNMLNNPVHLQHDHKTGLTEGAVHAYCNCVMWQYHGR